MMRIPKTVGLPWYKVRVELVGRGEVIDQEDGCWDRDTRVIQIADDITLPHQRYVLYHELIHAINDAMDTHLDTWSISERQKSRPAHSPADLVPVGGVGVTASLAVDAPAVRTEGVKGADDK